jgi:hypothetical protein
LEFIAEKFQNIHPKIPEYPPKKLHLTNKKSFAPITNSIFKHEKNHEKPPSAKHNQTNNFHTLSSPKPTPNDHNNKH